MANFTRPGAALALLSSLSLAASTQAYDTIAFPTDRGDVTLYAPSEMDPESPLPLVVSLHGYTSSAAEHENYFRLRNLVDERRFLLCVPNGSLDSQGERFWNATEVCCDFEFRRPDDSGYLRGLIEGLMDAYPVDDGSIHVVGHSNGGFMAYRTACDHSDLIASIASLAGATFNVPSDCTPAQPVHVLQIHGTQDDVIAFEGACFIPFFLCYPGARDSIEIWADYNGCRGSATEIGTLDLVSNIGGAETTRLAIFEECAEEGETELWSIAGGNHGPNFNGNFSSELVDWLLAHRRDSPIDCPGDFNGDGRVDGAEISLLLGAWGSQDPAFDLDRDGDVGGGDLSILLASWGACSG
ncbi:MAG: PHB depolymerase family esterase [Planctomycetota bacterium]|nr:PHB depolymerase family esterase [Planctomycetota bacterium]